MKIICIVSILFILGACSGVTPHQNFINHMNAMIGKNIDEIPYYQFGNKESLIQETVLPNGNIENKYLEKNRSGTCIYIFEIDPKSRTILRWRTEGDEKACIVNP